MSGSLLGSAGGRSHERPAHHAAPVAAALADFEAATREHGPSDEWDRQVCDRLIAHYASLGEPFSVNDLREYLPAVRTCLISRAFIRAQRLGVVRKVGYTPSTLRSTHAAMVAVYAPPG
jgi:hypothetical protein